MAKSKQPKPGSAHAAGDQAPANTAGATLSEALSGPATSADAAGSDGTSGSAASSVSSGAAGAEGGADGLAGLDAIPAQPGEAGADVIQIGGKSGEVILDEFAFADPSYEVLDGHVRRSELIAQICGSAGVTLETFADLPRPIQDRAVELVLGVCRTAAAAVREVAKLVNPPLEETVWITARSRDGQPYTRGGQEWTADWQTLPVPSGREDKLRNDPNLLVKAD